MRWQNLLLIIVVCILLTASWLCRYEIIAVPAGGSGTYGMAYRLDRWTGEVVVMRGMNGSVVEIQ